MTSSVVVAIALLSAPAIAQEGAAHDPGSLEQQVASSAWSDASWREDLVAAAELARRTHPAATERLLHLDGLNPERYLALRRPEPEVARELTRLVRDDVVPAALVAELLLAGDADYPFSRAERFGKRSAHDVQRLVQKEREQLNAGLMLALGDSRHESAFYVLRGALLDDEQPIERRRVAATALGKTRDARAVSVLAGLLSDTAGSKHAVPEELRTAAVAGLAQVRSLDALQALAKLAQVASDPTLERATALALGNGASAWALGRLPDTEAEKMRACASSALVQMLERSDATLVSSAVIDALGMVADPSVTARLRALQQDEHRPAALRDRARRAERRVLRAIERGSSPR